ncbi:ERF family protein [Streptomyces virens]|uniref:ERF family protein n=2 Tax=Actinomycetes TaxID=1760 RepID=A0ABP6HGK3_9ACTN
MIFSESNQEIAKALVAAWGNIQTPKHNTDVTVKTKSGGSYSFTYTDLDGIFTAVRDLFKENGLSIIQDAYTLTDGSGPSVVSVTTMFIHQSGEWVKSEPLRVPASPNMQDLGGQITYMKRYSLSAMLGIATEKDDDGNVAAGNEIEFQPKKLTEAQVKRLFAIANSKGFSVADVKKSIVQDYRKTDAMDLTKKEYDELCERLEKAGKEQIDAK